MKLETKIEGTDAEALIAAGWAKLHPELPLYEAKLTVEERCEGRMEERRSVPVIHITVEKP